MKTVLLILLFAFVSLTSYSQVSFSDAQAQALTDANSMGLKKNAQRNIWVDKNDVIHVFMFEDGNLLLSGFPTTALEDNKFQLHLYVDSNNTDLYRLEVVGTYEPTLNIDQANGTSPLAPTLIRIDYAVVGPFTGTVTFTLKHSGDGTNFTPLNSSTVKIAKTIHASIGTGFVYSTLKNPTNIRAVSLDDNSDNSTLVADNPNGNATLALMATLYPWGRNSLMLSSRSFKDRTGIVVGTTIASSAKNFENLYLGAQYDFAIGGSIVAGVDVAERQRIRGIDYGDFDFGKTVFTGNLDDRLYQSVGIGFFIGVQVDSRIFAKMFATP